MGWGCWEGFTEQVALELRPKGGYDLARNAKRETHSQQRDWRVQRLERREA